MVPGAGTDQTEAFRKLIGTAPQPGTNTILVTHKPNIVDALGKDWAEVAEGEASIFRPANGNYRLVARAQMDEWPDRRRNREVSDSDRAEPEKERRARSARYMSGSYPANRPVPEMTKILVETRKPG